MEDLSPIAQAVSTIWGTPISRDQTFRFAMVDNRPTKDCQAGLDELVEAGLLEVEPINDFGGVEYRPQDGLYEVAKLAAKQGLEGDLPAVEVFEPITPEER